jgi:hypothetical protein
MYNEPLERGKCYTTKRGEQLVFKYVGQGGDLVFLPLGESSFQDLVILKNWKEEIIVPQ